MKAAAAALALAAALAAPAPAGDRSAHFAAPGCDVALDARGHEPVLMLRTGCALDLATTVRALEALLSELYPARRIDGVASLSLGRIERLPWLAERVAAARAARRAGTHERGVRARAQRRAP